jgi:hypothetical protein
MIDGERSSADLTPFVPLDATDCSSPASTPRLEPPLVFFAPIAGGDLRLMGFEG